MCNILVPAVWIGWHRCEVLAQDRRVKEEMKGGNRAHGRKKIPNPSTYNDSMYNHSVLMLPSGYHYMNKVDNRWANSFINWSIWLSMCDLRTLVVWQTGPFLYARYYMLTLMYIVCDNIHATLQYTNYNYSMYGYSMHNNTLYRDSAFIAHCIILIHIISHLSLSSYL